ncbi:sugar kinase [Paracnuella aquatica]|uniref:sugar kinase n=1 Tax=Paracnuella aquatica TaxID=2268757 RepID=UPI000DEF54CF|nr:sugar kinase [Paracnuella aquatica]RPD47409.1 sugar kinase [Paracnuella aquatica]
MKPVLSFGELLLRMSPQLGGEWIRQASMPVYIGGAELNMASALALWGVPVTYLSAAPDNYLTHEICTALNAKGIATDRMLIRGERIGTYYLPQGTDLKGAGVVYDRAHSSFWQLQPGELDWDALLEGVSWFHFSAIAPALNENIAAVCKEALVAAAQKGITVSVDLNYRARLWQYGKTPVEIMTQLLPYCNVVMGNIWAAESMLGIAVPKDLVHEKGALLAQSEIVSKEIMQRYPACSQVANTFRFDHNGAINYYATLYTGGALHVSEEFNADRVVDKVGSGDCFMAGLIYGNYNASAPQQTIDFAAAAAFSKLFITGDATTATVADIQKTLAQHARK